MIINSSTLSALRVNFSNIFQTAYGEAAGIADRLCTVVPASTGIGTYGWLGRIPKMRQWVGPRQIQNMIEQAAQIVSADFELTVGVARNDIERDNLGLYPVLFKMMAQQSRRHADQLAKAALQGGTVALGFDGVPFFSALHPLSGTNQSNNNTVMPLTLANYETVLARHMSYVGEDGETLNDAGQYALVVPPALAAVGRRIVNADLVNSGETNVLKGSAELIVNPSLNNEPTVWYIANVDDAVRGLILQKTRAPQFVSLDSPTDPNVFFNKEFVYGVDQSEAVGYGPWWMTTRAIA